MAVLVTGASGYIGSHIVANLLSKGKTVRATVRDFALNIWCRINEVIQNDSDLSVDITSR